MDFNFIIHFMYVSITIATALSFSTLYIVYKNKKDLLKLKEYELHINSNISPDIPALLDVFVEEMFQMYIIQNITPDKKYINAEEEIKIRKDVGTIIGNRMGEALIDKLSLYYDTKHISEIIASKIYNLTACFVANNNSIQK